MGEAFDRDAIRAKITCDVDDLDQLISGNCTQLVTLKQYEGRKLCDLMGTTHSLILISSRLQKTLSSEGITGWATCPAVLKDRQGELISDYAVLATTGRCGPLINKRSPKVTRNNYAETDLVDVYLGYYFDEDSWDGSDIFRPDDTRMTIISQRAKDAIESINATNILMNSILEVERLVL